jgi:hypothetical protein
VRVRAWYKLHFKKLATLIGTLVQVEFLKTDGTPRYKRPMQSLSRSGQCPAMDVVVCFGILAIASDARYGPERLSGLVSAQQTTARQIDPLSSATLRSGIFVGVGHTGLQAQTRWKRQRQVNELFSPTTCSLSCGVQEQKSSGFGFC